jgi:acyl-CoA hydrolase
MVAMDENRKAVAVPPLVLVTDNQRRRDAAARMRRELRQEVAQRMKKARSPG